LGLVEVVIAMLLLGLIAMAILPALWQGIQHSSEQSSKATAIRFLNSLVDEARALEDCIDIPTVIGRTTVDGKGQTMTSEGVLSPDCASGVAATLTLSVTQNDQTLASTTARIFIP
jgi:type II secretory pathway pseudopilin PulG